MAACIALAAVAAGGARAASHATASVAVAADHHTRMVVESDAPVRFSLFVLRNPDRLVLDLEGVDAASAAKALVAKVDPRHPYIARPRVTRASPAAARVEIDLKDEIDPRIFASRGEGGRGYRVTLDLYPPAGTPIPSAGGEREEEILLSVHVNGQPMAQDIVARQRADGGLLVRGEDLRRWRFRVDGESARALDSLPGLAFRIDASSGTLFIEAPPALFQATALASQKPVFAMPPPAPAGAFANYDVFASRLPGATQASGQLELAAFNAWGVGVTSFLGRSATSGAHWVRLDSTWTRDMPDRVATLRVGDAIAAAGSWGRAVRFGGVQYATNFGTQPGFITFPLPGFAGEAVLPSTVDLYVNDALRMRRDVPTGPFSIQDLPVVTGQGDMRLVVRDALGREQVVVQPYYASAQLLQAGLQEYSYEAGFVRENFALVSNDYGRAAAVATHRLGFSDRFTGEVRVEALRAQQTAGIGGAVLLADMGQFNAALAASHGPGGKGGLAAVGFQRQSQRWGVGLSTQVASGRFVQLGLAPAELAPRQLSRAYLSLSMPRFGSIATSYTHQDYRDRDGVELVSASYSLSMGSAGFVSLSVLRFLGSDAKTVFGLNYTLPLDSATALSAGVTGGSGGTREGQVQVQRNLPAGPGYGYRVLAAGGDASRAEAGLSAQTDYGTYVLEVARALGETGYRASASGGVALVGGNAFPSRRVDSSFAVVDVQGYAGVRVYEANQFVARTNRAGTALVPRLLAYQKNTVRIEQADLPMDAQIDTLQMDAVPWFRSGMRLPFPVKRSRGALLTLLLDDGQPIPAGAVVRVGTAAEQFPVGLRGEVYLSGLDASNRLRASWRGQDCELVVAFGPSEDPLPDLGVHACKGVAR